MRRFLRILSSPFMFFALAVMVGPFGLLIYVVATSIDF